MRDHVYEFDGRGFLFTSPWVHTANTCRHAVTVLLSASGEPFEVDAPTGNYRGCALLVPTLVCRSLRAHDIGLVSVNVTPHHPTFAKFRHRAPTDALQPLDYSVFAALIPALVGAYRGESTKVMAEALANEVVALALAQLPPSAATPRRSSMQLLDLLGYEEDFALVTVAERLQVSYDRASHVVSDVVGLPLKSYMSWRKMAMAWQGLANGWPLAEVAAHAGFTDLSHFSRTWSRKLGVSPSYVRCQSVRIVR